MLLAFPGFIILVPFHPCGFDLPAPPAIHCSLSSALQSHIALRLLPRHMGAAPSRHHHSMTPRPSPPPLHYFSPYAQLSEGIDALVAATYPSRSHHSATAPPALCLMSMTWGGTILGALSSAAVASFAVTTVSLVLAALSAATVF